MQGILYFWIKKIFSQDRRNQFKKKLMQLRSRTANLKKTIYGTFHTPELMSHILSEIGTDFDVLMVHASYSDMLPMFADSPAQLVSALVDFCKRNDKTLVMPAFYFGRFTENYLAYYQEHPHFDVLKTPSQMGIVSEMFRRMDHVERSLHPVHSVCALGPLAKDIVGEHATCGTTFGEDSPFGKMTHFNTRILGIGVKYFRCLTQVHTAEDFLKDQYPLPARLVELPVTITDAQKNKQSLNVIYRTFPGKVRDATILKKLLKRDELVEWKFHGVSLFQVTAKRVTDALCDAALMNQTIYR